MVVDAIDDQQDQEGEDQQSKRIMIGECIVARLLFIVYRDRRHAGLAGYAAADHHDDAEFADGVGETEDGAGDQRCANIGKKDMSERGKVRFSESTGGFQQMRGQIFEACQQRIDHEGQAIDQRGYDESRKGEDEADIKDVVERMTEGSGRAEGEQKVETKDGRRQDHGQADDGFHDCNPAMTAIGQPIAERDTDEQEDEHRDEGQFQAEPEGKPVDHYMPVFELPEAPPAYISGFTETKLFQRGFSLFGLTEKRKFSGCDVAIGVLQQDESLFERLV